MKREFPEQEQIGLTPKQRLEAIDAMMILTDFVEACQNLLSDDEREEFQTLLDAAAAANTDVVRQHFFEQLKKFFIDKLKYDRSLLEEARLAQFVQQLDATLKADEDRDLLAAQLVPKTEARISQLRQENLALRMEKQRTSEIEARIQENMRKIELLQSEKDELVTAAYNKKRKLSVN